MRRERPSAREKGIGLGERDELRTQRNQYNLWVSTAARNGNYLAGVDLRIVDAHSGDVMLQGTMDGPWLFAELPTGRYIVRATAPDSGTLIRHVQIGAHGMQSTRLSFDLREGMNR